MELDAQLSLSSSLHKAEQLVGFLYERIQQFTLLSTKTNL